MGSLSALVEIPVLHWAVLVAVPLQYSVDSTKWCWTVLCLALTLPYGRLRYWKMANTHPYSFLMSATQLHEEWPMFFARCVVVFLYCP